VEEKESEREEVGERSRRREVKGERGKVGSG